MTAAEKFNALNELLARARRAPFYRDRLPAAPLASLDDIGRLPITTKDDVRRNSPFGLVCAPVEEWYDYYESFGTTGKPVSIWLSREDFMDTAREVASLGVALRPDDVVLVRFPYAISQIAHVFHAAAHLCGACAIPASSRSAISPFPRVIHMMVELGVSVLACLPLQAILLAETAELLGLKPGRDFPRLRAVCTAGEPLPGPRRALIEELWQVPVFDIYGMTEIGTAAVDGPCGKMHPIEDDFVFEVLCDDLAGPAGPGEVGRLVVTALRRRTTPIIRYLTGDLARFVHEECWCGAVRRLEVRGRDADAVTAGGRRFDLADLEAIAGLVPGRRLWAAGPLEDGSGIRFVVETADPGSGKSRKVKERMEQAGGVRIEFDPVPIGTLYDRAELLSVGDVGKPRYVYTAGEMKDGEYLRRRRVP